MGAAAAWWLWWAALVPDLRGVNWLCSLCQGGLGPHFSGQLVLAEPSAHVGAGAVVVGDQCCDRHVDLVGDRVELDALVSQCAAAAFPHPGFLVGVVGFGVVAARGQQREPL